MTTTEILARLTALHNRINVSIFFFGDVGKQWNVEIKYLTGDSRWESGSKIECVGRNVDFEIALRSAWDQLEHIVERGLGRGTLQPAIEDRSGGLKPLVDDEIPF